MQRAPLFGSADVAEPVVAAADSAPGGAVTDGAIGALRVCEAHRELEVAMGRLAMGQHTYYVTSGRWSAHDLLFYILEQTGPARVWLSTWALSEKSVRLLLDAIAMGLVVELNAVFDKRLRVRKAEIMQLAQQVSHRFVLLDCHAKVCVVENDAWSVSVVGSANFTNNKRVEAGVVCTVRAVNERQREWMEELISGGDPF